MATALSIIKRALRLIAVLDAGITPSAQDSADALETLNCLLAEWHEAGVGLPDYSFATLTTDLASDNADRDAIAHALAIRLAPEYGVMPSPLVLSTGENAMARMRLRYFQPGKVSSDELPGESSTYNITTDA